MRATRWLLVLTLAAGLAVPARATHVARPIQPPTSPQRGLVAVHPAFPIHRAPVYAYRPRHRHHQAVPPRLFLPLLSWPGAVVAAPPPGWILWTGEQRLVQRHGWTELYFEVHASGQRLLLDLDGPAQLDFAELTYDDGTVQVVDLARVTRGPATYELAPVDPLRRVAYVRVVARSVGPQARIALRLLR